MKKLFQIAFAIVLTVALLFSLVPAVSFAEDAPTRQTVVFGSYPQSKVTDAATIAALNAIEKQWDSYGYYTGGSYLTSCDGTMVPSDYMQYADIAYQGERYRAVTFSLFRGECTFLEAKANGEWSNQDDNGYLLNTVYYFRYEPLRWIVLDADTGLILCEKAIDAQAFQNYCFYDRNDSVYYADPGKTILANNYEHSSIRAWLNNDFFNTAFSADEQTCVTTTHLSNAWPMSSGSVSYASADTDDKVFLPSYWDVTNESYGFSSLESASDTRLKESTDYSRCQGLNCDASNNYYACWQLRSAGIDSDTCYYIFTGGSVSRFGMNVTTVSHAGVLPALRLNNIQHYLGCEHDCAVTQTDADSHTLRCPNCGINCTQPHSFRTEQGSAVNHAFTCSVCSYSYTEPHCFESDVCTVCGLTIISSSFSGEVIQFGQYPQSRVTDAVTIAALNGIEKQWVSYGYYTGSGTSGDGMMTPSDYMQYADIAYQGERYRAVIFSLYRPSFTYSSADTTGENSDQDEHGYYIGVVNYFRYEPLWWDVLDPDTGLILCEKAIDAQIFKNYNLFDPNVGRFGMSYGDSQKTAYANDYERSDIRAWLNGDFFNTAFSAEEQTDIAATHLSNAWPGSSGTVDYSSPDTDDKVFLPSYWDVTNESYGFSASENASATRLKLPTDYSLCQGLIVSANNGNHAYWSLRSAGINSDICYEVSIDGRLHYIGGRVSEINGIVPALRLSNLQDYSCAHDCETVVADTETHTLFCANCGVLRTQPHTYSYDYQFIDKPTLFTTGTRARVCTVCGQFLQPETVPQLAQNMESDGTLVYGLPPGLTADEFLQTHFGSEYADLISIQPSHGSVVGTGSVITVTYPDGTTDSYDVVIFGDASGDGKYDGFDAYIVSLISSGLLSSDSLGEAAAAAADCNHDGVIDEADVAILKQAGMLLNQIDQTAPIEELQTNSAFLEYCSLVDQSADITEPDQPTTAEGTKQPATQTVWGLFKALFTVVLNWLLQAF